MRQRFLHRAGGWSLLALCATAVVLALPSAGAAQTVIGPEQSWDPQTTNVPYLGWNGEEIRLEGCESGTGADASTDLGPLSASFLVEDWSGDPNNRPQVEPNTVKMFFADGKICAMGDVVSLNPGMARVELDVVVNGSTPWLSFGPAETVIKQQYLAGWMTLSTPTLTELGASSFASTAQTEAAKELGDPSGDGTFAAGGSPGSAGTPGTNTGYLSVKVSGTMPMEGAWESLVGSPSVTLPTGWEQLADALATDGNPSDTAAQAAAKWDISNDPTGDFGHLPQSPACGTPGPATVGAPAAPANTDSVDDCTGGGPDGPFSTDFGQLSSDSAIGPFDPLRAADTLLPNGVLDANDAPMPAARVDVSIAPNSGTATDISGVGSLAPTDKTKTYSRDFLGDNQNDNEYAPFYDQFIPATSAGLVSSGVDGAQTGDFNGFLVDGKYHNWEFAHIQASNAGTPTSCLQETPLDNGLPSTDSPTSNPGDYYQTPSGTSSASVYTDNHGEAQVQYNPGLGFYFDSIINSGVVPKPNADGGCDLQNLNGQPHSLGTSAITAVARYPFKPTDSPDMTSNTVTKSVTSLWSKTLGFEPKGTGAGDVNSRIVIAHAQNIDGSAFSGEVVCFSSTGESMQQFDGTVNGLTVSGTAAPDPTGNSLGRICETTDANGNAAIEVLESDPVTVDVIADFAQEGILRDVMIPFGTTGSTGGTLPPAPGTTTTTTTSTPSNTGTTQPTVAIIKKVAPALLGSRPAVKNVKARITLARMLSPVHGKHYVVLEVSSKSARTKLRLRLVVKSGKHKRTIVRVVTIRSDRKVKVALAKNVIRIAGVSLA
jgi:hypothetical protein